MERQSLSVQFTCNEEDGSYVFVFPGKEWFKVSGNDVARLSLIHI